MNHDKRVVKGLRGFQTTRYCPNGHDKDATGRTTIGSCRVCQIAATKRCDQLPETKRHRRESDWKRRGIKNADGSQFTFATYDRLYQIQQGSCKICQTHQSELKRVFDVDHSHVTGIVRGLLCHGCNIKVGSFESPLAAKIEKYLGE